MKAKTQARTVQVVQPAFPGAASGIKGAALENGTSPFTGAFELSFPIEVPQQRVGPELALVYSSHGGDGPFGRGMSLTLPVIARKTSDGVPRYDGSDRFVIDGVDLVADAAGTQEVDGRAVQAYMRRDEGAFDRIEHHQPREGNSFWQVFRADGRRQIFGYTAAARLCGPGATPVREAQWWLEEEVTTHGDHILYEYKRESEEAERAHLPYLKTVRFGNAFGDPSSFLFAGKDPTMMKWLFELALDYGEHDWPGGWPSHLPEDEWTLVDAFSRFDTGFEVCCQRSCRAIYTFLDLRVAPQPWRPFCVRKVLLTPDPTEKFRRLRFVTVGGFNKRSDTAPVENLNFPTTELVYGPASTELRVRPMVPLIAGPFQYVDLHGDGIPGILSVEGRRWKYWRAERVDDGAVVYASVPVDVAMPAGGASVAALMDLDGSGTLEVVRVGEGGMKGFFARDGSTGWERFVPFPGFPPEFTHSRAQLVDLTGDGMPDLVLIGAKSVRFYPNAGGRGGFASPIDVPWERAESLPLPGKDDRTLVAFADVLGSGQQHLIQIRHDALRVWPNLGHGRFGAPRAMEITMLPHVSAADFDPARIRLADLYGTGFADLVYLGPRQFFCFRNLGGRAFREAVVYLYPEDAVFSSLDQCQVADVRGSGCDVLVCMQGGVARRCWTLDATAGGAGHLVSRVVNRMGGTVEVGYGSSAHEWLRERSETPTARCRLPFPRTVVKKVLQADYFCSKPSTTQGQNVLRYEYAGGCYDAESREFRGFAKVRSIEDAGPFNDGAVRTSWYHTGAADGALIDGIYEGDASAGVLSGTRFENTRGEVVATPDAVWHRALLGQLLREEVRGITGSQDPYEVASVRYCVREVQAKGTNAQPVLLAYALERLDYVYERDPKDPRWQQEVVLAVDAYGAATRTLNIFYPRRPAAAPLTDDQRDAQQDVLNADETLERFVHLRGSAGKPQRLRVITERIVQALIGIPSPTATLYSYEVLVGSQSPLPGSTSLRSEWRRFYYDDLKGKSLALGTTTVEALLRETRTAIMSKTELNGAFDGLVPAPAPDLPALEAALKDEGGFYFEEDHFWRQDAVASFARLSSFFRILGVTGKKLPATRYTWDTQLRYITRVVRGGETTSFGYDPFCMRVGSMRDPNDNLYEAFYDALGRLKFTSFRGTEGMDKVVVGFGSLGLHEELNMGYELALAFPEKAIHNAARAYYYDESIWLPEVRIPALVAAGVDAADAPAVLRDLIDRCLVLENGQLSDICGREPVPGELSARDRADVELLRRAVALDPQGPLLRRPARIAELAPDTYFTNDLVHSKMVRVTVSMLNGFGDAYAQAVKAEGGGPCYVYDPETGGLKRDNNNKPVVKQDATTRWIIRGTTGCWPDGRPFLALDPYYLDVPAYVSLAALEIAPIARNSTGFDGLWRKRWTRRFFERQEIRGLTVYAPWSRSDYDDNDLAGKPIAESET